MLVLSFRAVRDPSQPVGIAQRVVDRRGDNQRNILMPGLGVDPVVESVPGLRVCPGIARQPRA